MRYRVEFATGTAASVAKRRSYRDLERNDIEQDLPDWPTRPAFEVRGFFGKLGVLSPTSRSSSGTVRGPG
ncbi:hypothetical protein ABZ408_22615 [Streptomyces tibetensis]|uniref:Uncharacterized protein n=1 Tax=Streptomyces tibetensis TaxID=2382123 RepID=A0ABW6N3V9_9ACTN